MGVLIRAGLSLSVCAAIAACAPSAPESSAFDAQVFEEADTGGFEGSGLETNAETVPKLDGTWLQYQQMASCVDLGQASWEIVNRTLYIVNVIESDDGFGALTEEFTACDIELTEIFGLLPRVPDAILEHAFPFTTRQGMVTGTSEGFRYASGAVAELWGIAMDDPVADAFVSSDDCERVEGDPQGVTCADERIFDMDQDGKPGVTLEFSVCEAYVVQRTTNYLTGYFVKPDRIEGSLDGGYGGGVGRSRQVILDATEALCRTEYEVRSNDDYSQWARQRIDGLGGALNLDADGDGAITCDEVLPYQALLFERRAGNDEHCER